MLPTAPWGDQAEWVLVLELGVLISPGPPAGGAKHCPPGRGVSCIAQEGKPVG